MKESLSKSDSSLHLSSEQNKEKACIIFPRIVYQKRWNKSILLVCMKKISIPLCREVKKTLDWRMINYMERLGIERS